MLKTRILVNDLDELVTLMIDFEKKLIMWSEKNINATWDVKVYIGDYEYIIEVEVDSKTNKKDEDDKEKN